jgi:hypothetical protein
MAGLERAQDLSRDVGHGQKYTKLDKNGPERVVSDRVAQLVEAAEPRLCQAHACWV